MSSIACLAWGSLVWKPAHRSGAPLEAQGVCAGVIEAGGSWRLDGPHLPIELARTATSSNPEELYPSWVICAGSPVQPALWTTLRLPDNVGGDLDRALAAASLALAVREGADVSQIGRWPAEAPYPQSDVIGAWAERHQLDGVVWTALPPRWIDEDRPPTLDEVLALLRDLSHRHVASYAEDYIRRTPPQIDSPFRAAIERELGWRPVTGGSDAA